MNGDTSSLIVDIRPGEKLSISQGQVSVELVQKSGQLARLRVTAPKEMKIEKLGSQVLAPSMAT